MGVSAPEGPVFKCEQKPGGGPDWLLRKTPKHSELVPNMKLYLPLVIPACQLVVPETYAACMMPVFWQRQSCDNISSEGESWPEKSHHRALASGG